jgi:hypothetical protein
MSEPVKKKPRDDAAPDRIDAMGHITELVGGEEFVAEH